MAQNQYNRSHDNDREPEPEQTLGRRIRFRLTVMKEDLDEFVGHFRKAGRAARERSEARKLLNEEQRDAKEAVKAAKRAERDAEAGSPAETPSHAARGKDELTQTNRVSGDRIFSDVDRRTGKKRRAVSLTPRFGVYLAVLFVALVATQALQSKASNVFIGFIVLLPFALLFYTLTARLALDVHMISDGATVKKGQPHTYEMRIYNRSFLAYPFVEAVMILPQSNAVRCSERSVYLSMAPFGKYDLKNEVRFRFRGTYHIGVDCFYVYDFFRIFRVKVGIRSATTVLVLPRQLLLGEGENAARSDEPDPSGRRVLSTDRVEVGDVRGYLPGDPLKSIHWNLSSRSEDLVVKDYDGGTTGTTYIYCDLAARFPEDPPAVPTKTRSELRKERADARERKEIEARKARVVAAAAERGETLDEETLRLLDRTKDERRADTRARREEKKREKEVLRLQVLERLDPKKAARLRDRIYDRARKEDPKSAAEAVSVSPDASLEEAHLLAEERFYEDMNEYCADGIIELTVATALRELRRGCEVVLLWYDSRSETGACAYSFRSAAELQTVYPLFATAPMADRDAFVGRLSALGGDLSGIRQIFVTSAVDRESIGRYSELSSLGALSGGSEILLYSPQERFLFPGKRLAYIEGCREELMRSGFRLSVETTEGTIARGGDRR